MLRIIRHPTLRSSIQSTLPSLSIIRNNATTTENKLSPQEKAKNFVEKMPDNPFISKTGFITLGTGALAFALSKEIYVFNEETAILGGFVGLCFVLYKYAKDPICQWADEKIQHIHNVIRKAREEHHSLIKGKVESVAEASNIVDVTKTLFDMSKEMTELEAKAFDLKQKTALVTEIKTVLDAWVRHEASVRERQQKQLATQILERLQKQLEDPKVQQDILNQCIADIEAIGSRRK